MWLNGGDIGAWRGFVGQQRQAGHAAGGEPESQARRRARAPPARRGQLAGGQTCCRDALELSETPLPPRTRPPREESGRAGRGNRSVSPALLSSAQACPKQHQGRRRTSRDPRGPALPARLTAARVGVRVPPPPLTAARGGRHARAGSARWAGGVRAWPLERAGRRRRARRHGGARRWRARDAERRGLCARAGLQVSRGRAQVGCACVWRRQLAGPNHAPAGAAAALTRATRCRTPTPGAAQVRRRRARAPGGGRAACAAGRGGGRERTAAE
jgi:hypothetical protein